MTYGTRTLPPARVPVLRARTEESHARPQPRLVSAMPPFRLFGPPPEPDPAATPDDAGSVSWAPGPWTRDPAPATRHARPVGLDTRPPPRRFDDDPPTDPHGFPPIPAASLAAWPVVGRPRHPVEPPPDPREAAALAGAFAADYLSWDEDDPGRRGRVLADHLAARRPATRGCSAGTGSAGSGRSSPCRVPSGRTATTGCWSTSACGSRPTARWATARPTSPGPTRTCPVYRPPPRRPPDGGGTAAPRTGSG